MAFDQQYVSKAIKMYQAIQPVQQLVVTEQNVIDVQFRELPNSVEVVMENEVRRLIRRYRANHPNLF
ncbi:hypothetical protein [Ralstonia phage RSF1]|uniref:Uncharacterized protein n=1 Tax=Ralstonia phage RSF1 TaxID=1689679 RepID=A0A0K2QQJ1_9CAUD|nr:hypothetical protein AVU11_gp016 [Ralstonia phage RSF1]BAS04808.1 hypothetical protein [Ralstonia phage RSF1]